MKRLIPLLLAIALPTILFAQGQPGSNTRDRERPGLDNNQDSGSMDSQDNPMDADRNGGHGQRGLDRQRSYDGSRDQQGQRGADRQRSYGGSRDQQGQRGADRQRSYDGSRDRQWQSMGDGDSRGHSRHGTEARRFRFRDRHRSYGHDSRRDRA
jgi:hypothetical protein